MRGLLRSFLKWLDTRFPEKLTVTLADYQKLQEKLNSFDFSTLEARLQKIEVAINNLSIHAGFGGSLLNMKGTAPTFKR